MTTQPPHARARTERSYRRAGLAAAAVLSLVLYTSYTALNGLPWQSQTRISVELPNASRLVKNDAVRINGVRVGRVVSVGARPARRSQPPLAVIELALDKHAGGLPVDTHVRTRAASLLGASYVELTPGRSTETVRPGATLPLANTTRPVDITDLFDVFRDGTASRVQELVRSSAEGMAGRGPDANATLGDVARLLAPATRMARSLNRPSTRLTQFITGYADFASTLAPVSAELAGLVSGAARTFGALARERRNLALTIERFPPAATQATSALRGLRPALGGLASLTTDLRPAVEKAPRAFARTTSALNAAVEPMRRVPGVAVKAQSLLRVIRKVAAAASTDGAVRKLDELLAALGPTAAFLATAQINCNVIPVVLNNAGHTLTDWLALPGNLLGGQALSLGFLGFATGGAEGELLQGAHPARNLAINYLPNENQEECEAGNEMHDATTQRLGNVPGLQAKNAGDSAPPPDAVSRAREAGLLTPPEGWTP